jgi:hypothetical protein
MAMVWLCVPSPCRCCFYILRSDIYRHLFWEAMAVLPSKGGKFIQAGLAKWGITSLANRAREVLIAPVATFPGSVVGRLR